MIFSIIQIINVLFLTTHITCFDVDMVQEYFNSKNVVAVTVFACSLKDYINIFKQSVQNYQYVSSGSTYLNDKSFFTNLMHYPYYKLGVYLDYNCKFGKDVLLESSQAYIFNGSYIWFIRINSIEEINNFEDLNFGLDSDVTLAIDAANDDFVELYDVYKINSTSDLINIPSGSYSKETGMLFTFNGSMLQRRQDFKGFKFNTAIVSLDYKIKNPITDDVLNRFMNDSIKPESDAISRSAYIFCSYLAKMYNFTLNIHTSPTFGYPIRKGPILHDGMIGEIENKMVDFGLSAVAIHIRSRLDVAQFTSVSLWRLRMAFMFCHPRTLGTYKALIIPFTGEVWIFVVCLTFGIGLLLSVIKYFTNGNPDDTDKSYTGNIIITIGALYQQGLPSCSHKIPERIILLFTLITGLMIVTFYNSMIVTSLLKPPPKYITTPTQLLKSSFDLILQNHTYPKNLFGSNTADPILKNLYKKAAKGPVYVKPSDGVALIQTSKYALFAEESSVYTLIDKQFTNDEICMLQEIEVERPSHLYLPLKRNSPLKEFFNYGFSIMREVGIIHGQYRKWHPHKPECRGNLNIPSVELQSLLVAFLIMFTGVIGSLLVFCVEVLYSKYKKKQNALSSQKKSKKKAPRSRYNQLNTKPNLRLAYV